MKILITGGCGYVGTVFVNELLNQKNFNLVVLDNQWFGNHLNSHNNLKIIKEDIRNLNEEVFREVDIVVHLANIANDPAVDLNPNLSWEVNVLSAMNLIETSIKFGVKQFIYASSGSVYGLKKETNVTEDLSLVPISAYNKTKMIAERVLLSYSDKINLHIIRPATVCGFSPRMRLDVSVNMLTFQALENSKMTVFGGNQIRPNIHIKDLSRVYMHFISNPNIQSGCYNAGFENLSINSIAKLIKKMIPNTSIDITESNDNRSYRLNSDKLLNTGFKPLYNIKYAIEEIIEEFNNGNIKNEDINYTIKWMKKINL
tara:strand:- start:32764 stop:33708 length:945 start_codon:yes stop_codon:yes gene_type:complete